ncbi:MAG: hypothetical protein K0R38_5332 [Polyangiaceae bacterium]|jgi:hypothetical protein|nr:hypothetical protein [Polyangiaceae bacterium]
MSARLAGSLTLAALVTGCSGEPLTPGFEEPLRIPEAQFRDGELPGLPPLTVEELGAGVEPVSPTVVSVTLGNAVIPPREPSRSLSGLASADSAAIGVRFADLGHGYWLLPTGSADPVSDGALEWRFRAAFAGGLPAGRHELLLAAIDGNGRSGNQVGLTLCLLPEVPDNGNACSPSKPPPDLVVSLGWDTAVDLDLRVVTPDGKVVDPKHPTTAVADEDGKLDITSDGVGQLDYDSYSACRPDGHRRESLVFQRSPPAGTYLVYAGLFDACGQPGVTFDVSIHVATSTSDGVRPLETFRQSAQLSAVQADGGAKLGTYVTAFVVE